LVRCKGDYNKLEKNMQIIKSYLSRVIVFLLLTIPVTTSAQQSTNGDFGLSKTKYVDTKNSDIAGVIGDIVKWLLGFVGALAVLMIIVAGIMYLTSGGDEGRVEKAKQWLIYAIVGLIVALLGWVIVSTVIGAL